MHWLASSSYNIRMRKVVILSVSPPPSLFLFSLYLPPSLPPSLSHSLFHFLYLSLYLTRSLCFTWKKLFCFSFLEYQKRKKKCLKKSRNLRLSFNAYLIFKIIFTYSCKIKWYKNREHFQKLHKPQHVFFK